MWLSFMLIHDISQQNFQRFYMSLINKEEAHSVCQPYYNTLTSVFDNVWKNWLQNDVARRLIDKRVRSAVLRNDALFFLKDSIETSNLKGIKYVKMPYQVGFLIQDRYFVRIKKGDKSLRSSNYPTQRALDFHNPEMDMFGGLVRLELLYILSDDGVGIDKIVITQRNGKFVAWAIDLTDENLYEMPVSKLELNIPQPQPVKTVSPAKSVVKPKRARKAEPKVENGRGD